MCYIEDMKDIVTCWTDFERHMEDKNLVYVDKTEYVYKMARRRGGFYFISRPRRFGKSLMCSTFDSLFSGKRDLFDGLWISNTDYDFKAYPVLRFDFSKPSTSNYEGFLNGFRMQLRANAMRNKVSIHDAEPAEMLDEVLSLLSEPVIIIDEFDSTIIDAVSRGKTEFAEDMRVCFNSFYKVIKSHTGNIRFFFITGCTKLSGLSIFSAMNNLRDISMDPDYATAFGYTEDELVDSFSEHIDKKLAEHDCEYKSRDEFLSALRNYYDGYRFSLKSTVRVYNPVSIGNYFSDPMTYFRDYWMYTGGANTLAVTLAKHNDLLRVVEEKPVLNIRSLFNFDIVSLSVPDMRKRDALSLLYYAGYLTISETYGEDIYLDFPNGEVEGTFLSGLVDRYGDYERDPSTIANDVRRAASAGDVDKLIGILNGYYRAFHSTELKQLKEMGIQVIFKALFVIAGSKVMTEVPSGLGRLDAMLLTDSQDYIIEFKVDGESSDKALSQIADRHYAWILEREDKPLHLIGIDFCADRQQIASYTHQVYGSDVIERKTLGI